MAETERAVADFSFAGRVWGLYYPPFYGMWGLFATGWSVDAFRQHHLGAGVRNGTIAIGGAVFVARMFRAVCFRCVDGSLTISQRRGKTASCNVAAVRRLEITSRKQAALLNQDGNPVLEIDWRLMTRGDLKRLATRLGIPYRTYTDVQFMPLQPLDPLIDKPLSG
jgi:hypothetical protein